MVKEETKMSCLDFKSKLKVFSLGIVLGCIGGLFWQEYFTPINFSSNMDNHEELAILHTESNEKLLKYIEGKGRSSIGDLIINIDDADLDGSFLVIESVAGNLKRQEIYKIAAIDKINGLLGIIKLKVCDPKQGCEENHQIPIQINKIFGTAKTITMTFDTRFAYCMPIENLCTRAFKEID